MEAIKDLAQLRSITDITALHNDPALDIQDPGHPLNVARDELLERPDVQGSYFATDFNAVIDRAADTDLSREELVALERQWIEIRHTLQSYEYGDEAFDHALIAYEERAAARDQDIAKNIDPDMAKDFAEEELEF